MSLWLKIDPEILDLVSPKLLSGVRHLGGSRSDACHALISGEADRTSIVCQAFAFQ